MRKRLRKWLGINTVSAKYILLEKQVDRQRQQIEELKGEIYELKSQSRFSAPKDSKPQPQQMKNWREFIATIEQGKEISA